jgi:CBS domain-containing protein
MSLSHPAQTIARPGVVGKRGWLKSSAPELTCVNVLAVPIWHPHLHHAPPRARVQQEAPTVLAIDIMTPGVIIAAPDTPIAEVIRLMLSHHVSAIPIVERDTLVGIVSEGDLIRRAELGTESGPSYWHVLTRSTAHLAAEYVHTHGRTAKAVMTAPVITVADSAPLAEIADLLDTKHIKSVPVLREGKLLGIVSRADLLRALAARIARPGAVDDRRIREAVLAELSAQPWGGRPTEGNVIVQDGVVHLWGYADSASARQARVVVAESTAGVRRVEDHMEIWTPPDPLDRPNWPTPLVP